MIKAMETVSKERGEAIAIFGQVCWLCMRLRRKHLRLPVWVRDQLIDQIMPHWQYLTYTEQTSVMFLFNERSYIDTVYRGPMWKLFFLKSKTMDLAAVFVLGEHKRLN